MAIDPFIVPIVNILVGALILIFPGMLRLLVGGYLLRLTPTPGFEPGYPFGNWLSRPAQYRIVPRRQMKIKYWL